MNGKPPGISPPNYTQIPNVMLDRMSEMTPAEFMVLAAIARKTFGWHKASDVISLTQLQEATGLSRSAVQQGIIAGMARGMIDRTLITKQSYSYRLLVVSDYQPVSNTYKPVASDYQSTQTTSSEKLPEPVVSADRQLVVSDYTQKKGLKKLKERQQQQPAASQNESDEVAVARQKALARIAQRRKELLDE